MIASIASLYRHPIKGFTPESVQSANLCVGEPFPHDRLFAVEDGPSPFDRSAPVFIRKQHFTVLAKIARVAKVRTAYNETSGVLTACADGHRDLTTDLNTAKGKAKFAAWLAKVLGDDATGPLQVLDAPGHRFLDDPRGHVSVINLASVRDLETRLGQKIDPMRFRANLYVEGWPAWVENDWSGQTLNLGTAEATVFAAIIRCAAVAVDPVTAERDIDVAAALHRLYGHVLCGIYLHISQAGSVSLGDRIDIAPL